MQYCSVLPTLEDLPFHRREPGPRRSHHLEQFLGTRKKSKRPENDTC